MRYNKFNCIPIVCRTSSGCQHRQYNTIYIILFSVYQSILVYYTIYGVNTSHPRLPGLCGECLNYCKIIDTIYGKMRFNYNKNACSLYQLRTAVCTSLGSMLGSSVKICVTTPYNHTPVFKESAMRFVECGCKVWSRKFSRMIHRGGRIQDTVDLCAIIAMDSNGIT